MKTARPNSRLICAVAALLFLEALGHSVPAQAQATPDKCTPNGWGGPTTCIPMRSSPWKYEDGSIVPWGPLPGQYKSMSSFFNALTSYYQGRGQCSQWSNVGAPWGQTYFTSELAWQFFTYSLQLSYNSTCQFQGVNSPWLRQRRDVSCPAGWVGVWSGSAGVCACASASCGVPRAQVTGELCKGNPCAIIAGDKVQRETDYVGAGTFPLQFMRTYYSGRQRFAFSSIEANPIGVAWMGSYLQWIQYVPTPTRSGAYAYRPDGSIIAFNETPTSFYVAGEVGDRLEWIYDGGGAKAGFLYTTAANDQERYDLNGRLSSITRRGVVQTLSYDSTREYLASVTDSFGHVMQFQWDSGNPARLASVTLPGGGAITFGYGVNNNLTSVTYPDTRQRQYLYELTGSGQLNLLTGLIDENGVRFATWSYSGQSVTSSEHAGGVDHYGIVYNGDISRTVTDPLNTARTYTLALVAGQRRYTTASSTCSGCGESASVGYDANGNYSQRTDFNGRRTDFVNDLTRNLEISRTEASGTPKARTITTQWHPTFRLPTLITEPNRTTGFTYNSLGNVLTKTITDTSVSPNVSRTWTYTYDSFGQVLTEDGPRTDVTDVTTDMYYSCTTGNECGQLHTITNALSQTTTFNSYNAHGQPLTITDPNGVVTTLTYDARQRLTSRQVGTETTTFEYWPTGLLKKVTLPDASYLQYTYDAAHRLTNITDSAGNHIDYTLDAMGNRTAENAYDPSNALARTRTQVFNSLNQLWKQIGSAGTAAVTTVFGYDSNGNQTTTSAPLSRNTANQYDELNRLKQITDPGSGVTQFGYDANDNLTAVTDPRSTVTNYTYNGFGDVTQLVSPDTSTSTNTYDSGGNLYTATDARSKTGTYSYDALNRVTQVVYPNRTLVFTYDAGTNGNGGLTGASDANHSLAWTYDAQGRVTAKSQTVGTTTKSVSYGYTNGDLTSLTTPSGQVIGYGYTQGRITSVTLNGSTTILNQVLYEPFGPIRQWTWGNATLANRTYDLDGIPSAIDSAGDTTYALDNAFRITGITDLNDSTRSWTYGYDLLDRLNSASKTGQTIGYTFDANGNRLTQTGTQTATYTISSTNNSITSIAGTPARTYAYDAAGNTTGYGALTYGYSDAGRMVSVTTGGVTTSYVLNALGQRVKKSNASLTGYFVYDEAGHLLGEYDGTGALIQETVWMGDIPVATLRPNGAGVSLYYVHTDHLNTPRRISRPSDNVILWRWDSDPFGTTAANEDPDGDTTPFVYNLRVPGQYFDAESGLSYNYFRDYDTVTGGYIESDPIGLAGGINTYAYADGDPIRNTDRLGLFPFGVPQVLDNLLYSLKLPTRGDCKEAEKAYCASKCAPARSLGCYVSISWKLKGIRGGEPIRSEQRTVNCNCEDLEGCVPAPKQGGKPAWLSSPPVAPPWWLTPALVP
jgi:RHS repeat-associated protein